MLFTNYYRKFIQAVAILVFAFFSLTCSTRQQQPLTRADNPAESAEQIKAVCESLPKPEGFQLVEKNAPSQPDYYSSVSYSFHSSRSKEEIYPTFVVWFNANGWQSSNNDSDALVFQKINPTYSKINPVSSIQTIYISPKQSNEGNIYTIVCSEGSIKAVPDLEVKKGG